VYLFENMQVAIIAGGFATRLAELTTNQPKSMVRINGRPFLEYQLEVLRKAEVREVVLCIGHLGEQIISHFGDGSKYGLNIKYSFEDRALGTAGALKKAEPLLNDIFFSLYGDSYLLLDYSNIMTFFKSQNKPALMTVYRNYDQFDKSNTVVNSNLVTGYSKKDKTGDMVYIDYGANIFRKEVLGMIPENQYYPLEYLFTALIEKRELLAYEVKERFYEIGSLHGLKEFTSHIEGGVFPFKTPA
jgi:NDP-sugar pyrophosphorylase family protein